MHALGDKHTGLAKVLEDAGVKERHDMAELKKTMQVPVWRLREGPLVPGWLFCAS